MPQLPMGSITNHRATFLTMPDITTPGPGARARILAKGPTLQPGRNTVPDAYLAALEKLDPEVGPGKVLASWKAMGYIGDIVRATDPRAAKVVASPEGVQAPATLAEYDAKAAIGLVKASSSMEDLARWAQSERRSTVRQALQERVVALQTTGGPALDGTPDSGGNAEG